LSNGEDRGTERHPDALIHELIASPERIATTEEITEILNHIARALFNTRRVRVTPDLVGEEFLDKKLGQTEDSLTAHLAKRIADDQWTDDTTREDFLNDIRRAVKHPEARLVVYRRRDTNYAAVASPNTVPPERRGDRSGEYLVVFYSANRARIISARQARDESVLGVPEEGRWLSQPGQPPRT
jgi:hypothetical protein